jgi:16S rRNA (cytosine1402-N4)-methyltransferase
LNEIYHIPVLSNSAVDLLINPGLKSRIIVDGTLGGGGYSMLICSKLRSDDKLIAVDKDLHAIEHAKKLLNECNAKLEIINGNFGELKKILSERHIKKITGIVLDLGLSSYQLESEEGFSFMKNTALDMRADKKDEQTAASVLNFYSEKELSDVFENYGEIGNAKRLSKAIAAKRRKKKLEMTFDLVEIIDEEYKIGRRNKIDFLAKIFQALRIEVNNELENLKNILSDSIDLLVPGGRIVIVSYHSLEDRIVKFFFRDKKKEMKLKILTKKPLIPERGEISSNPRSRSAKLRAAERL